MHSNVHQHQVVKQRPTQCCPVARLLCSTLQDDNYHQTFLGTVLDGILDDVMEKNEL